MSRAFENSVSMLNDSMDHGESAVNRSFNSVTSANSSIHTTASSSKAVLAALRALQDKIRRLEAERSQALDEASDLRSKIKSFEIETEHSRQREAMQAQRQVQEAKIGYEKLLQEKKDLEERLGQVEERNRHDCNQLHDLAEQSNRLSETKSMTDSKLHELTIQVKTLESQLHASQQREKEFTHAMIRETKKHEDEQQSSRLQVEKLTDDLARASSERAINETKLSELDHLVGQLLSVNESLLRQLSGKPVIRATKKTVASAAKTNATKSKDSKTASSKISKLLKGDAGTVNVGQLTGMHEMYKTLAKSIVSSGTSEKKTKTKTRMSKKKSETETKVKVKSSSSSNSGEPSALQGKKVNIRLPSASAVSYDFDSSLVDRSFGEADSNTNEYQDVISSLENEFDELNEQYRHLLSSASVPSARGNDGNASFQSDQLVDVIQKLHRKGEQLRAVKSPQRSSTR